MGTTDAEPPPVESTAPADDAEAAAVWARLAPHAKKSFTEALDDYFADTAAGDTTAGDKDAGSGGPGGTTPAGGPGDAGGTDTGKARAKAQSTPDIGREISEFFFGKSRKT